jgi:hypothetical protein
MAESARPQLVSPRQVATLDAVRQVTGGGFDVDAWHVMEERDNALVADEILHGPGSSTFVYQFEIKGTAVAGISVIGARHLANHYKGLKHRLVAAQQKTGALFVHVLPGRKYADVSLGVGGARAGRGRRFLCRGRRSDRHQDRQQHSDRAARTAL